MKRLIIFAISAAVLELLAMQFKVMDLPPMVSSIVGYIAIVVVFLAIWEKPNPDERERILAFSSSHIALLIVGIVLTGLVLVQTIMHKVDPFLLAALGALVVGKIIGRLVAERRS